MLNFLFKKSLVCIFICVYLILYGLPVSALPGESLSEIKQWVKNHSFLSSYYFQERDVMGGNIVLTAFRQLKNDYFIDVVFHFHYQTNTVYNIELVATKRRYNPNIERNTALNTDDSIPDNRPWEIIEHMDIWTRDNPQTLLLLKQIFGESIANDFKSSKLVYDDYILSYPSESVFKVDMEMLRNKVSGISDTSTLLYLGKHWGYQKYTGNWITKSLILMTKKDLMGELGIHEHNRKMYKAYLKEKTKEDIRNQPADIILGN